MILGAVGTGKTSACMYPYVDQLLRWRADDPDRKIGGLVLEVKGDFCQQVRRMLTPRRARVRLRRDRLDGGVCYNPLHNDLDPYAVAFAIATLVNNLFGKSKEPFWQQAYTDLLKFVILLRRIADGYTTFAEVYRYILDDSKIESDISTLKATLAQPPEVIVVPLRELRAAVVGIPWTHWFPDGPGHMAHPYDARARIVPARAAEFRSTSAGERHRVDRAEAPARGRGSLVHARLEPARPTAALVHHRRHRRVPVALRREPGRPPHVLPAAKRLRVATEARRAAPAAAARGTARVRPRAGAELPGRHEPRPRARARRDAEAGFPARRAPAHPEDGGPSGADMARPAVRLRRVPRVRDGRRNRPDRRRAHVRACRGRRG